MLKWESQVSTNLQTYRHGRWWFGVRLHLMHLIVAIMDPVSFEEGEG